MTHHYRSLRVIPSDDRDKGDVPLFRDVFLTAFRDAIGALRHIAGCGAVAFTGLPTGPAQSRKITSVTPDDAEVANTVDGFKSRVLEDPGRTSGRLWYRSALPQVMATC